MQCPYLFKDDFMHSAYSIKTVRQAPLKEPQPGGRDPPTYTSGEETASIITASAQYINVSQNTVVSR